ncbi:Uncharacterised protein [Vibrio cholerae]|nr:Uncharacterised protein [Vibrio cholerae]
MSKVARCGKNKVRIGAQTGCTIEVWYGNRNVALIAEIG